MENKTDSTGIEKKLWDLIKDIEIAMFTTREADGTLRSRPMRSAQIDFDGDLWFFTRASSHVAEEVRTNWQVNLSYADPDGQDYVSVSGVAKLVQDRAKAEELWTEELTTWFPKGLNDPDLALIRVAVDRAEYWDAPSSTMVHAYGYVKAKLSGESPKMGEHEKINFR